MQIGSKFLGAGHRCLLIAEVGQAHDGSLGAAHAYVDAVARSGADAIKFQTHFAAEESSEDEPWRIKFSPQDPSRFAYWQRMEFTEAQWRGLAEHARDAGLIFLSSPFSEKAVELLEVLDVPAWKVASGEMTNEPLLERMASTGKPVLLSSGMSGWNELDRAVMTVKACGSPVAVMQATTAYPCPPEMIGLNNLNLMRERYGCPVGLSDHSARIYAGLAAASLGADFIEAHVVFSRECFGPDTAASITTAELSQLVQGLNFIHRALTNPTDKDALAHDLEPLRATFGKSIVAASSLTAGNVIALGDLAFRKPGTGIPVQSVGTVLGRRLRRDIPAGQRLAEGDLE